MHIRYHQQEETLKLTKIGWLAALVAVAAVFGAVAYTPTAVEAAPTGATKTCGATTAAGTASCTLEFSDGAVPAGPVTYTISLTGPATFQALGTPTVTMGTCGITGTSVTPGAASATVSVNNANAGTACTISVPETLNVTGAGSVSQTVSGNGGSASASATVTAPPVAAAAVTQMFLACDDNGIVEVSPGEVALVECVIDIDDNSATPDLVSSGIVSVTIGLPVNLNPNIAAVTINSIANDDDISGNVFGGTANVRCGAANTPDSCDFVILVIAVQGGPVASNAVFTVEVTANYVPDNPALNTPAVLPSTVAFSFRTVTSVVDFVNGDRFIIRCTPTVTGVEFLVTPGQIGGINVAAVGILPAAVPCEAGFLANGAPLTAAFQPVAPGTIEISALAGTLVDLTGRLTTNLRIGCGTGTIVSDDLGTINPNTCLGVRFAVLGAGVGFVEVRARYEPNSAAAAAGIREREAVTSVAFVAPAVSLSLIHTPNPVAVGATGTSTLRFNRSFFFTDGTLLIDPTTGLPIAINFGTPLNGTVIFESSNTAIASFTGALTTTTGTVLGGTSQTTVSSVGTNISSGSASVRCGTVAVARATGLLADFFGGCDSVAVGYRGNAPGVTTITATFLADLPGAFGQVGTNVGPNAGLLANFSGLGTNSIARDLEVVGAGPATTQRLVPGCNNVVAPANETVQQVAARVDPASAVISIWKQVPGTTTFQGAAIGGNVPAGVSNLASVNALDAIFVCVNAAATYRLT